MRSWIAAAVLVATSTVAFAFAPYDFSSPLFGLDTAPDGSVLVADAGAGVVELRDDVSRLIAALPGVTDIASVDKGVMFALRGGGPGLTTGALFAIIGDTPRMLADLYAFEAAVNPHPTAVDSNPFDVEVQDGRLAIIADAGGNTLLKADKRGKVDWIASFPNEIVTTAEIKAALGCPNAPVPQCGLGAMMPAQAVSTSVAIGPDGAYYVGELKGFPAPLGQSRIWRVEPGTLHAQCGTSSACVVVFDGFTSIIDLLFGPDGKLYVVELDEASWFAVDAAPSRALGGTVNACDLSLGVCEEVATQLPVPTALTVAGGKIYVTSNSLNPALANVVELP